MAAPLIYGLGYVRIWQADVEAWRAFGEQVVGMSASRDEHGTTLLRMDDWVARVIVEASPRSSDVRDAGEPAGRDRDAPLSERVAIGWECPSAEAWSTARAALEGAGIAIEDGSGPTPWCRDSFSFVDPSGFRSELFYGGKRDPATHFVSPRGVRFVTGNQGMGHVTVFARDASRTIDLYTQLLGFQIREAKTSDDGSLRMAFLSPGPREHSLALIASEDESRLAHVLIEVADLDDVGRAMDRCLDGLAPMTVSIGRHWNDEMISFYLRSPSGFDFEYGFGGRRAVSAEWSRGEQGGSGRTSSWGHRRVDAEGRLGPQLGSQPGPRS